MAQFKSFDPNVEVLGGVIMSILEGMGDYKAIGQKILSENGIDEINPEGWYPLQNLLDAMKIVSDKLGADTLYLIGSKIPEVAMFPPGIENLEQGMPLIDMAYHMNHRNGEIGSYSFKMIDENTAEMVAHNPYPCDFDRGLCSGFAKKFPPTNVTEDGVTVMLDDEKESRQAGAETSTYTMMW